MRGGGGEQVGGVGGADNNATDSQRDDEFSSFGGPSRAVIREHIAQSFKRFDAGDKVGAVQVERS
jgi:hypothetical protein